ncbi:hypothetical protein DEM27_26065 [Metarhizobium album]|uniref:TRAP transporter small permease protein n=1 Tax=Metarhizobium album TaxID=2182425 RepID=A0A2U2DJC7_9HYPH|nr:TRAP transporter small permease [Rhizobium album]PWE53416.1 hypothetical protein DEM27_26065 [Rhizobium album]
MTQILFRRMLRDIPRIAIGLIILVAIAINAANIIGRYIFQSPLDWAEEVLTYLMIWGVCLGASAVTYENRHLNMDLFVANLDPRLKLGLDIVRTTAIAGLGLYVAVNAWKVVNLMSANGQVSAVAGVPIDLVYLAFVVGFILMALSAIAGNLDTDGRATSTPESGS